MDVTLKWLLLYEFHTNMRAQASWLIRGLSTERSSSTRDEARRQEDLVASRHVRATTRRSSEVPMDPDVSLLPRRG